MEKLYQIRTRAYGYVNKLFVKSKDQQAVVDGVEQTVSVKFVDISAQILVGPREQPEKRYFQINVITDDTKKLLLEHKDQINDRDIPVTAAMTLHDITPDSYENSEGKRVHCLKSNLGEITMLRVGKEVVYQKARPQQKHVA